MAKASDMERGDPGYLEIWAIAGQGLSVFLIR
jgi:hypothetical protein